MHVIIVFIHFIFIALFRSVTKGKRHDIVSLEAESYKNLSGLLKTGL